MACLNHWMPPTSMQAGLRRAATGILGGLFQTCLQQAGWRGGQDGLMQRFF